MSLLLEELSLGMADVRELTRFVIRLVAASLFGALIGYERERKGKPAGLRTHMLVALGSALMVVVCEKAGMNSDGISRVIQGLVTGIGFLGAGSILKMRNDRQVEGLTTAAGIWLTCGVGIAVGIGGLGIGLVSVVLSLIILVVLLPIERRVARNVKAPPG